MRADRLPVAVLCVRLSRPALERFRGVRIFDISDIANPKQLPGVQTCRGSHTNTLVTDPNDKENVYLYLSGYAAIRSPEELPGCSSGGVDDPNTALYTHRRHPSAAGAS